jgi:fused signal recognition particle receptor
MIFWRKKKNIEAQEQEERGEKIIHPQDEPDLEPSEDSANFLDTDHTLHEFEKGAEQAIGDIVTTPEVNHSLIDDLKENEDLRDHSQEGGWLSRLTLGLSKTSQKITTGLGDLLTKKKLDQQILDELEELLISADLGPSTAAKIIADFSKDRFGKDISEADIKIALADAIAKIMEPVVKPLFIRKPEAGPFTILVCGVNGVGKTTTIGKMAQNLHMRDKHSVMLAAGDTFRAAAVEQLQIWAERTHTSFYGKELGADAASVAYEAYEKATADDTSVLIIDTAGRLHNKSNLMDELAKIMRVLKKKNEVLPHECILVLDATTGQNAIAQVETFKTMVNVTGLVITKLDGSARGGIVVTLADKFGLPIYAVGVGETAEDLQPFQALAFAQSLVGARETRYS